MILSLTGGSSLEVDVYRTVIGDFNWFQDPKHHPEAVLARQVIQTMIQYGFIVIMDSWNCMDGMELKET